MPVANEAPKKRGPGRPKTDEPGKGTYKKKDDGPHTDATAAISRDEKPLAKDGSRRGRLPGSKNKSEQLLQDAQAKIKDKFGVTNWHPVIYMMLVAADPDNEVALRLNAAGKAAPYVASQLKAVELTGEDGGPIEVDLTSAKQRLAKMAGLEDDDE